MRAIAKPSTIDGDLGLPDAISASPCVGRRDGAHINFRAGCPITAIRWTKACSSCKDARSFGANIDAAT